MEIYGRPSVSPEQIKQLFINAQKYYPKLFSMEKLTEQQDMVQVVMAKLLDITNQAKKTCSHFPNGKELQQALNNAGYILIKKEKTLYNYIHEYMYQG